MMLQNNVVLGLVDSSSSIKDEHFAAKCRDLTITWARYSYHGPIIEDVSVDRIIKSAVTAEKRYCLILAYGQILYEEWTSDHPDANAKWVDDEENGRIKFLVATRIRQVNDNWYGLDNRCLLVNLKMYSDLGQPRFDVRPGGLVRVPNASPSFKGEKISRLDPLPGSTEVRPTNVGWNFVAESLKHGLEILSIDEVLQRQLLDLSPERASTAKFLSRYFGDGLKHYDRKNPDPGLTEDQTIFLGSVANQTQNAKRGVFMINIEPYTDVDNPCAKSCSPISTLYTVAAGFKPLRILQSHRFNKKTRVVYFDYSRRALDIRKTMITDWHGEDFPSFLEHIFNRFPHPDTFYQLWEGKTPHDVDWSRIEADWQQEVNRFGGPKEFTALWNRYRQLKHEFICCDIVDNPDLVAQAIIEEEKAVIWFSNAPFTMYYNWRLSFPRRKEAYERWISLLNERNPRLLLYGADFSNTSVNGITVSEYWKRYRQFKNDELNPCPLNWRQISS